MVKNISELYNIKGKGLFEYDAIKDLPKGTAKKAWSAPRGKSVPVHQADGSVRTAYLYGESTWSYSEEEIIALRQEYEVYYAEQRKRKALLDKVKTLSTEELEALVKQLGL